MQNTTTANGAGATTPHINFIDDEGNLVEFGDPMEGLDLPEDTPGFMEVWDSREGQPARRRSHQAYVSDCEDQYQEVSPPEPSKIILRTEKNLMTGQKRKPKGSTVSHQQRQAPTRTSPRFASQQNPQSQALPQPPQQQQQQQQQYQQHLAPTPPPQQNMHPYPQNHHQPPAPLPQDPHAPITSHFLKPHEIYDPRPRPGETEAAAIVRSACIPKLLYLNGLKRAAERGDVNAAHELVGRLKLAVNDEETDAYGRRDRNGRSC